MRALVAISVLLHYCDRYLFAGAVIGDKNDASNERTQNGWADVLRAVASGAGDVERQNIAKCFDIPSNFSLCYGMQYTSMRLPNLLDHDTLHEAIQQSKAWNSLLQLHCHPDAKLYLCSLFAPICLPNLDRPLYPCQSLCLAVQQGCESRMVQYGFPWPEMLRCRFPADNDMCIKPAQPPTGPKNDVICKSCAQIPTFENLIDNYCRSKMVWKIRLKSSNATHVTVSKVRGFKSGLRASHEAGSGLSKSAEHRTRVNHTFAIDTKDGCSCPLLRSNVRPGANFLLMAGDIKAPIGRVKPTTLMLLVAWRQDDKNFKRAIRRYRKVNCNTLGREIRESVFRHNYKPTAYRNSTPDGV